MEWLGEAMGEATAAWNTFERVRELLLCATPTTTTTATPSDPSYTTNQLVGDLAPLTKTNVIDRVATLLDADHVASLRHEAATRAKYIDDLHALARATVVAAVHGQQMLRY